MKPMTLVILAVLLCAPWALNVHQLSSCDFESPYKCEVIHAVGVFVPPASFITAWFAHD